MELSKAFNYDGRDVRTIVIKDAIWFAGKDCCDVLGIRWNGNDTLSAIKPDWKGVWKFHTPGKEQEMVIISEAALYKLIARSRKPEAIKFMEWIFEKVIPEIRQTGSYAPKAMTQAEMILVQAQALVAHERQLLVLDSKVGEHAERIAILEGGTPPDGYYTAVSFCIKRGIRDRSDAKMRQMGKLASKLCKERGIYRHEMTNERYKSVWAYPEYILVEVLEMIQQGGA